MPRIYLYKLSTINGGAPCDEDGLLTLAICKPMIRSSARDGDFLVGVAANSVSSDNQLVYVSRVTQKLIGGAYFKAVEYGRRRDCIYAWTNGKFEIRPGARYHGSNGDMDHDLGLEPGYSRANTLLSSEYRYFGMQGTADYRKEFLLVSRAVAILGRGHRVNHGNALFRELETMIDQTLAQSVSASSSEQHSKSICGIVRNNLTVKRPKPSC